MSGIDGTSAAVGLRRPRLDSAAKVTGTASYAADILTAGLLHARPVLSPYAHARIAGIDPAEALGVFGVKAVLTAADLPIHMRDGMRMAEPLAWEEVVFAGQPVALVVAETEAAAEDAAELLLVDYEPLEAVLDIERAIAADGPLARVDRTGRGEADMGMHAVMGRSTEGAGGTREHLSENVVGRHAHTRGDLAAAFAGCAAVVEGRFRTSWVHQGYLEPQAAVAWLEGDGRLVVTTSTQGVFFTRDQLARLFGLSLSQVRVVGATLGGAFGGKVCLVEPLAAAAALRLRRPVRVVLTRMEDFALANPAPACLIDLKIGARADGTFVALQSRILVDDGAFPEWSPDSFMPVLVGGPYRWEAWETRAYGVLTNRWGSGAYRGPGGPQTTFARESLVDELAAELGLDPIDIRLRNAIEEGDLRLDDVSWPPTGLRESLEAIRSHPLWLRRHELPPGEGIGVAAGLFFGVRQAAGAVCRMDGDGGLTVVTGAVDMTGTFSAFAAIAAETFGVPIDQVRVVAGDTETGPQAGISGGSTITYSVGRAVQAAAADARERLLAAAAEELEIAAGDLEIVDGVVRPIGSPDRGILLGELGATLTGFTNRYAPAEGHGATPPGDLAPSSCVHLAHVRVDPETGSVRVVGYVSAQDVGRAINPALCEGQMRGGVAQAIGWALCEELVHDDEGQLLSASFLNYALPRAESVPPIETIIVEVPSKDGPFGAKGIGESAVVPGAGAIANAVAAATGARLRELPMKPARVWVALESGD